MFHPPVGVLVVAVIALIRALIRSPPQLELEFTTQGCRQGAIGPLWSWGDCGQSLSLRAQDLKVLWGWAGQWQQQQQQQQSLGQEWMLLGCSAP
jgi:hypothetical protein